VRPVDLPLLTDENIAADVVAGLGHEVATYGRPRRNG